MYVMLLKQSFIRLEEFDNEIIFLLIAKRNLEEERVLDYLTEMSHIFLILINYL